METDRIRVKDGLSGREVGRDRVSGKPILLMGFPHLKVYLLALVRLTEEQAPLRRQLRAQIQAVAYIMVDVSGLGFGPVIWKE